MTQTDTPRPAALAEYAMTVRPLTAEEGGGYLVEFPDLPGCMSDGETVAEALANAADAQSAWLDAMREAGRPIPVPSSDTAEGYSGKWVLRAPRSLHRSLAERAKREGVSLNMLSVALLAEGIGVGRQADLPDAPKAGNRRALG